jgi:hypothetical protein
MADATSPHPRLELRLATTRFHPDRVTGHAPSNRVVPANQPIRKLEPDVNGQWLFQLTRIGAACCFL